MKRASGFQTYLHIQRDTKDTAKFAPAESPVKNIYSGSIPRDH